MAHTSTSPMELELPLPFVVNLDDTHDPADAIDALLLGRFVAGTQPVARTVELERVRPDATLLPPGVEPIRRSTTDVYRSCLAIGDGWTLRVQRWKDATATLTVHRDERRLCGRGARRRLQRRGGARAGRRHPCESSGSGTTPARARGTASDRSRSKRGPGSAGTTRTRSRHAFDAHRHARGQGTRRSPAPAARTARHRQDHAPACARPRVALVVLDRHRARSRQPAPRTPSTS